MPVSASINKELDTLKNSITELGTLMQAVLPFMEEGTQVWDASGHLVFANAATVKHYGGLVVQDIDSSLTLASRCLDENGASLPENRFPIHQVIETNQPCTGTMVQIRGQQTIWLRINAYPIFSASSKLTGVLSTSHDVTEMIVRGLQLEFDAHFDALTGLPNRLLLPDRVNQSIARSCRTGQALAICMLDLDGFKPINDRYGHEAGDLLLQEIAQRLEATLRGEDTAVRLGGDEFVLLIEELKSVDECEQAIHRVLKAISQPFQIKESVVSVTASLGATLYPNDSVGVEQLLRHADQAMYKAKDSGKNTFQLFDPTLESRLRANQGIIKRIEDALLKEQFELYYQPKIDCVRGQVIGVEALIRWNHPVMGIRSPMEFLPLIERHDLIIRLGDWVLESAMQQLESWQKEGIDLHVSVNVSARQLLHGHFDERLDRLLTHYPPKLIQQLELEVLETAALEDMKTVGMLMRRYQSKGIAFALDDFGTGYSSLAHLKHLSADELKIDQSFVRNMLYDPSDLAIIQGIVGLANAFQREVVAEGVESIDQMLMLLKLGCHIMQGYCIAHPMPADKIADWTAQFSADPRWKVAFSHYPSRNDFELLLQEVSHRNWLQQLMRSKRSANGAVLPVDSAYSECHLSTWYAGIGLERYQSHPEFQSMEILHREVHKLGEQLLACNAADEPDHFERLKRALTLANEKLVHGLNNFRSDAEPADRLI